MKRPVSGPTGRAVGLSFLQPTPPLSSLEQKSSGHVKKREQPLPVPQAFQQTSHTQSSPWTYRSSPPSSSHLPTIRSCDMVRETPASSSHHGLRGHPPLPCEAWVREGGGMSQLAVSLFLIFPEAHFWKAQVYQSTFFPQDTRGLAVPVFTGLTRNKSGPLPSSSFPTTSPDAHQSTL